MLNDIKIMFVKCNKHAVEPRYARYGDAACDLCTVEDVTIKPGQRALVGTGIKVSIPYGFEGQIRPRSGNAWKRGITVVNSPGTIDAGYRGEIKVALINLGDKPYSFVTQLKFSSVYTGHFIEAAELDDSERGVGGFGHTDND